MGRWLVLVAALAGIFAMHGLSEHGSAAVPVTAGMTVDRVAHLGHHPAPVADVASDGANGTSSEVTAGDYGRGGRHDAGPDAGGGGMSGGHGIDMIGLCLAVLAAAAAVAVGAAGRRWWRLSRRTARALAEVAAALTPATGRIPQPPDLHQLCIARC